MELPGRAARSVILSLVAICALAVTTNGSSESHTSKPFSGKVVNGGTVTHTQQGSKNILTVSEDFRVPDSPDAHWQVVDSKGRIYLLQKLSIKDNKINRSIAVPSYVSDIAKVQMWCAWAEVLLGEAPFDSNVRLTD